MNIFNSFEEDCKNLFKTVIASDALHAKWLNTLSYLENSGARKIAACQHPTLIKEEMLKHAAEEFRHAHFLKRQISKISMGDLVDYTRQYILGGASSLQYLHKLDVKTSRYLLNSKKLPRDEVRKTAYLLVTYAIELRAEVLYTNYDLALRAAGSKVNVKSILLEEKEHLKEMLDAIDQLPHGQEYAKEVCKMEETLCVLWMDKIFTELNLNSLTT